MFIIFYYFFIITYINILPQNTAIFNVTDCNIKNKCSVRPIHACELSCVLQRATEMSLYLANVCKSRFFYRDVVKIITIFDRIL